MYDFLYNNALYSFQQCFKSLFRFVRQHNPIIWGGGGPKQLWCSGPQGVVFGEMSLYLSQHDEHILTEIASPFVIF